MHESVSHRSPCVFSVTYLGCGYNRGWHDEELGLGGEVASPTQAESKQGIPPVPLCQSVPTTLSSLSSFISLRGEEQREGGGRQQCRPHTRYSVHKSWRPELSSFCSGLPFPPQIVSSLTVSPLHVPPGGRASENYQQAGFLGELRQDGAWRPPGCSSLCTGSLSLKSVAPLLVPHGGMWE